MPVGGKTRAPAPNPQALSPATEWAVRSIGASVATGATPSAADLWGAAAGWSAHCRITPWPTVCVQSLGENCVCDGRKPVRLFNYKIWIFVVFCSGSKKKHQFFLQKQHKKNHPKWVWGGVFPHILTAHKLKNASKKGQIISFRKKIREPQNLRWGTIEFYFPTFFHLRKSLFV